MKRSRKVLNWIGGIILALIVVVVIVIATFDWNRLKPFIDDKVSQAIGRPFAIQGNLSVEWRREPTEGGWHAWVPWPEFTARDIRIGNPAWAAKPQFAQLDALRFRLSPLPLITHTVDVPSLQLVHPTVDLERNKQGQATWDFTLPQDNGQPSTWNLQLGSIGFDRGEVSLDDAAGRIKLQVGITPLQQAIPYDQLVAQQSAATGAQTGTASKAARKVTASDAAGDHQAALAASKTSYQFAWKAEGSYQGAAVKGDGKTGAVLALQEANQPFPVQADVRIGDSHIALVGTLTDPVHLAALDLKLWFSGSSMAKLYAITGVTLPNTPPYATEGHLRAELHKNNSRFSYENFHGHIGGSDTSGSLLYTTVGARPKLSGNLSSQMLQFADLAPLIGGGSDEEKKQRGDTTVQPKDKLLPVEPFSTDRWKAMDADVTFSAARIVQNDKLPINSLNTHLVLDNGVLQLAPLNFGLAGGTVQSTIRLDGSKTLLQGTIKIGARHLKLKQLFPTFAPMQTAFGEINGDVKLTAHGNSVAALLGSSNGEMKLLMNDGAISKTLLETAGLNVGNIIIGKLFGDRTVPINCAASDMTARNGLFTMNLFVFDTDDAVIKVDGTIDFATEKLDLNVRPQTKGFRIFSLRTPLYARGTLKNPDVGVQKVPLIVRGAGAVALGVVAAPAAALLALIAPDHDDKSNNTCRDVLQQLRNSGSAMPATEAATKSGPVKKTK
ncbi:AsmA family protein [Rhodanobacter sp. BL-MT-08]